MIDSGTGLRVVSVAVLPLIGRTHDDNSRGASHVCPACHLVDSIFVVGFRMSDMSRPRTLFEKVWEAHIVSTLGDGSALLYIDCHLVNEVTSPQAFEALRAVGRRVRRPAATVAVADHNVPTERRAEGAAGITEPESRLQVDTLERNVTEFGVPYVPLTNRNQGIVHIIGPELGLTWPGSTIVCGDSHTSTHGAFGALAFGIGTFGGRAGARYTDPEAKTGALDAGAR